MHAGAVVRAVFLRLLPFAVTACLVGCFPAFSPRETDYGRPIETKSIPTDAVYFELFGNGVLFTLNYEKIIDGVVVARFGGLCLPSQTGPICPIAPIMVGYLLGTGANKLELGFGAVWVWNEPMRGWTVGRTGTVAWRYQPWRSGFMWKMGWTPILALGPAENESAPVWLGIASGYTW